jgi:diguanylate cyclase (GGDEF)-like protein
MSLDISTLVLLTITVAYGLGGTCIFLTFHRSGAHGTRHWGRGLIGLGAGYTLLYLYPKLGTPLLYAGWLCLLVSILIMYRALLRIIGSDGHRTRFGIAVVGAVVLAWLYFGLVAPDPIQQVNAIYLGIGVIGGRAAWDLWRHARRSRFRAPPLTVAAWLLLVAARPVLEVLARDPHSGPLDPMTLFGPVGMVFFRVLVMMLLTISVIWMEISRLYETVEDQATHDELTGVANRRAIVELLERELARSEREDTPFSIAIFDIDSFKRINDTMGHPAGDQVIKWVTAVIGRSIRPYDTLARYGGEEFLLLMPGAGPASGATVAERARLAIQNGDCVADGKRLRITVSAGVATWSKEVDSDALLRSADHVLYRAKQTGRNRVVAAEHVQAPIAKVVG